MITNGWRLRNLLLLLVVALLTFDVTAQRSRPRLIVTGQDVGLMKAAVGKYPLFDAAFHGAQAKVDTALARPMDVPQPVDAGGYTHERHKQNYTEMQLAGILYAVTGDEKYARFVRDMLLRYATLYPTLKGHPMASGEATGRLFWQTLNETVWLVHVAQAYDCIHDWLARADREKIESGIFRPMAAFFTIDHAKEHDRIHNHGTWTVAAVGMLGFALDDKDLVEKALYGTKKDKTGGFLRQLDLLFSPDGYYTEGPYYTRYALMPFFLFAQAIENNLPDLKIFEYRDQILKKAFYACMQQTYTNGAFIPFNDALKEKSFLSPEIVLALDITYARYGADKGLLSIAHRQNAVMLSGAGLAVARDAGEAEEFVWKSMELRDGANGDEGGIGMLRSGGADDQSLLLMKYTAHGQSHGHYDKLAILYYDQGREILQDYGSARFINVEPKFGGRYLPETRAWAMQTIAHNTVTVDEQSHFQGKIATSEKYHGDRHFFSDSDPDFQIVSAKVNNTYKGVQMQRTVAMVKDPRISKPILIDVFRVASKDQHQYDLPFYYMGHMMATNVKYTAYDKMRLPLGEANGYQYLWKEAEGVASGPVKLMWLNGQRYYSITSAADSTTQVLFTRIGANDPNFNLRNEPAMMLRKKADTHVFATVLEPHGLFDPVVETSRDAVGVVQAVRVLASTEVATAIEITGKNSLRWVLLIANGTGSETARHEMTAAGVRYEWIGNYYLQK